MWSGVSRLPRIEDQRSPADAVARLAGCTGGVTDPKGPIGASNLTRAWRLFVRAHPLLQHIVHSPLPAATGGSEMFQHIAIQA